MSRRSDAGPTALDVYWGRDLAGMLALDSGRRFVFQYDASWLESSKARPLSISLPLESEPYAENSARPFFANLLPEAQVREIIARRLGISEKNDFLLLERLGGECAGAVSLWPQGSKPPASGSGLASYRKVTRKEIADMVAMTPHQPLLQARRGWRLSLAGAQEKLPVHWDGVNVSLAEDGAPSTHILKPPIVHFDGSVENEAFCMKLAGRAGLPVPEVSVIDYGVRLFVVRRFDRARSSGGRIDRIHQEDFCQALGLLPDQKYESEGGPRLAQCFDLLARHSAHAIEDRKSLLHWVIFNVLIGNADGHAKNLSLLHEPAGVRLAPFYDILCTSVYPALSPKLAQKVGGENRLAWLQERHWERLAADIGVKASIVFDYCVGLAESLPELGAKLAQELAAAHGDSPTVSRLVQIIDASAKRLLERIGG